MKKPSQKKDLKKLAESLHSPEYGPPASEVSILPDDYRIEARRVRLVKKSEVEKLKQKEIGRKDDAGKLRWSLLPWKSLRKVVEVLEYGARKYSIHNWQKVEDGAERYKEATLRHIESRLEGEILDPESGLPHLAHAACDVLFWIWFEDRK